MKHYTRIVLNLIFIILSFGYVGPALISFSDTVLVVAGIFYLAFIVPGVLWYLNASYIIAIWEKFKND